MYFCFQYFVCFLKKNLQLDGKMKQYVQWCLDNCNNSKVSSRQHPPSTVEIAVSLNFKIIYCVFFRFLNLSDIKIIFQSCRLCGA